ncbi:MAG: DUF4870 domain-containing protein [Anaerolineales bacterium]|nr:DUF4870 domain-containing protein [Anaerolineales bacterium]
MSVDPAPPPVTPPASPVPPAPPAPLSDSQVRTWAMLAHLTVLLNLVTGFLGVVAPLVIYVLFKERSRYVAFQAMQSFVFQLIWWAGGGLLIAAVWGVTSALSALLVGLLCVPFALIITLVAGLMPVVALIYGVYGAIEANAGEDFRYWLIGDWVAPRV